MMTAHVRQRHAGRLSQVANDAGDNILTKHGCQEVQRLNKKPWAL